MKDELIEFLNYSTFHCWNKFSELLLITNWRASYEMSFSSIRWGIVFKIMTDYNSTLYQFITSWRNMAKIRKIKKIQKFGLNPEKHHENEKNMIKIQNFRLNPTSMVKIQTFPFAPKLRSQSPPVKCKWQETETVSPTV